MAINFWVLTPLVLCALFCLLLVAKKIPWFLGAMVGFYYHLKAAKIYHLPRWRIWLYAPALIWGAFKNRLDYGVMLRDPDISFNYRHGIKNHITNNVRWLDYVAAFLRNGRTVGVVPMVKNEPDLKINEDMEITVGNLRGLYLVGQARQQVLFLHPRTPAAEMVIGFDLARLLKTVEFYAPEIDSVVVVDPRSMIDGKHNTIEYLAARHGVWVDKDHLAFKTA